MASKGLTEGRLDKVQIAARIDIEDKYKLVKKYGGENASISHALIMAIKFSVRDVELDDGDKRRIAADIRDSARKRLANREANRANPSKFTIIDYSKYT